MEIVDISIFKGKNIYSHNPVMKMIVDIGKYNDIPTKDINGFNDKLLKSFPNLKTNTCGLGYEGGFLERLEEGTYLAHVLEHVILDIQNSLGFDVKYGKTRALKGTESQYYLIYEYMNEICAFECSKIAVSILNYFINGEDVETQEVLEYLYKIVLDTELGPSTAAIVDEAKKRNIPVTRIGYESLVRIGYGKYSKMIQATLSEQTSCISADISSNKQLTKAILNENRIPVPFGKLVYTEASAIMAANQIGIPVVIKPLDSNQGKGVHLNLTSEEDIKNAFKEASKYSPGIIVEKYVIGNDYRILVVGNEVKAVSQRLPAMVIGDGSHTIKELIDIINAEPERGESHEKALTKIKLDDVTISILEERGIDENYIPAINEKIILRKNANISTGGTAIDCTDIIHEDNAEIAIRAAEAIGIDIAGIDMVAQDISKSILSSCGAVIEVNTAPGIRMHLYPSEGKPRNVAKDILDFLFPDDSVNNFPIVSVTGTNGKTTTVRMISHVLATIGKKVGMTTTSGTFISGACNAYPNNTHLTSSNGSVISKACNTYPNNTHLTSSNGSVISGACNTYPNNTQNASHFGSVIGEKCICKGDNSGPQSAKTLLTNKLIDAAVFETARGGIIREGLGYDLADVGVITNITDDHLGIDGVETIEDLAFVKSLVAEAIKPNGYAVLNAEDEMTNYILRRVKARVILFHKNKNEVKVENLDNYINVFVDNGVIKIKEDENETTVMAVKDMPITNNGLIECNIDNALASICALYGLKVPIKNIVDGLITFKNNPGRFQFFNIGDYKIMLDYAHNEAGYKEIIKTCKNYNSKRLVGIVGMPGDRSDDAIKTVSTLVATAFDKIYIKEDMDLRGRQKGEVATIIYNAIAETSYDKNKIEIIENEADALKHAMEHAEKDDLIVVLYENIQPLLDMLIKF